MEPVTYQKRALGFLSRILASGDLPGSLLFTGDPGLGKREAALAFAMAANCQTPAGGPYLFGEHGPCGACPSCKKIRAQSHPDVLVVERSGAHVRIVQVRALLETLAMRPHGSGTRVVILPEAQALNREAGNALLKVVEEPPERTLFILIAPEASRILPTLVSRSHEIRFFPVPEGDIARWIAENRPGTAPEAGRALAVLSRGSLVRARELAESNGLARRDFLARELAALARGGVRRAMMLADLVSRDKDQAARDLEWIALWLRDLLVRHYAPERIVNADLAAEVERQAGAAGPERLLPHLAAVADCERDLAKNVNPRMAFEALFLQLAGMKNG
ncbi:MAG: DNA polymerase III subunit delta' [Proteobacteria bacterium]|nr:DNA polymerase III subunit delta' [Pseudomonadota bacterium]